MIRRSGVMAAALMLSACATAPVQRLDAYARTGDANWAFANGEAHASKGSGPSYLVTREDYTDFEFTAEVYVGDPHNSGVFIRCADHTRMDATRCYEVNVFDKRPDQAGRTGGVPGFFKPLAKVDAANRWNTMKIIAKGPHLTVVFDGVTTVDSDGPITNAGAIALQWGDGDVRFRNVRIRRL